MRHEVRFFNFIDQKLSQKRYVLLDSVKAGMGAQNARLPAPRSSL